MASLEDFEDPEVIHLHQRASDLFEDATLYDEDEDRKNSRARVLYREAESFLDDMDRVLEEREKY
jgi:hypothetical protein